MQVKDHLQEVEKKDQEIQCLKLKIRLQKETNDNLFRELNMSIEQGQFLENSDEGRHDDVDMVQRLKRLSISEMSIDQDERR